MSECTCCCSVWLNVWFSPRVTSPFLCFFIYHYCCAELLALVAACLLSCFRFMHHSCTVCIVVSTLQVQVYTCVWWHVLGKGGRTHGPFICCSHSSLVLRDLHIVCAKKKKKTLKKAAHFVPKSSQAQVNCNCGSIPNLNGWVNCESVVPLPRGSILSDC